MAVCAGVDCTRYNCLYGARFAYLLQVGGSGGPWTPNLKKNNAPAALAQYYSHMWLW